MPENCTGTIRDIYSISYHQISTCSSIILRHIIYQIHYNTVEANSTSERVISHITFLSLAKLLKIKYLQKIGFQDAHVTAVLASSPPLSIMAYDEFIPIRDLIKSQKYYSISTSKPLIASLVGIALNVTIKQEKV